MKNELDSDWRIIELNEICSIDWGNTSITKESYVERGYPAYSASGQDGFLKDYEFENDAIVLSAIGARCGKCFLAKNKWNAIKNTIIIRPNPNIPIEFLFYQINNESFWMKSGAGQPFITISSAKKQKIRLPFLGKDPDFEVQQKIGSIISNVDNTLEKTNQLIEKIQTLKKGMMQKLFTKGIGHTKFKKVEWLFGKEIEIPEEWEIKNLDVLCSQIVDGPHVSPKYVKDGIPFLTVNNVMDGFINLENVKFISNEDHQIFSKRAKPVIGDILYTKGGTTGIAKIVDVDFEFSIWVHLALLKVKNDVIDSKYLELFLNSYLGKKQAKLHTYGIANKDLVLGRMKQILVNLPSLSEQKQIAEILSNVDSQINKEKLNKVNLESLKKGLMQKLLTGQIRVKV